MLSLHSATLRFLFSSLQMDKLKDMFLLCLQGFHKYALKQQNQIVRQVQCKNRQGLRGTDSIQEKARMSRLDRIACLRHEFGMTGGLYGMTLYGHFKKNGIICNI